MSDHNNQDQNEQELSPVKAKKNLRVKASSGAVDHQAADQELRNIYLNKDGETTDMSTMEQGKKKRGLNKILLILVFVFAILAAVSWAGFFLFGGFDNNQKSGIDLQITAPADIEAGDEVTYEISLRNNDQVPISRAELRFDAPRDFMIDFIEPPVTSDNRLNWILGVINPGEERLITIKGKLYGEAGKESVATVFLNYKPANFNSDFQELATASIKFNSPLTLEIDGPAKVSPGQEAVYELTIGNATNESLHNIVLQDALPADFIVSSMDPSLDRVGGSGWRLGTINSRGEYRLKVTGSFTGQSSGDQIIGWSIGQLTTDEDSGTETFYAQQTGEVATHVLKGELSTNLLINGQTDELVAEFGEILNISLTFTNQGTETLSDLDARITLDSSLIDWSTLKDPVGATREGSVLTWTKDENNDLASLEPEEEGSIDFSVQLKPASQVTGSVGRVIVAASVALGQIGEDKSTLVVQSKNFNVLTNSDLSLTTQAVYYDETGQVGLGPLPPRAGESTTYRVDWVLRNTLHELRNVKVSAVLPADVEWTGVVSNRYGELVYDEKTGLITWTVHRLPLATPKIDTRFNLRVTPKLSDIGSTLPLIGRSTVVGTDTVTNKALELNISSLDTKTATDAGVVVE